MIQTATATDGVRHRTRLDRASRREQILDAATAVLHDREPSDVTFEEIADAAGVSRALVYNYFGDRSRLLEALYLRTFATLDARAMAALTAAPTLRDAVRGVVRVHLEFAVEDPAGYRLVCAERGVGTYPQLDAMRIARLATFFGGQPHAELIARGAMAALETMVRCWAAAAVITIDEAELVITGLLWSGFGDGSDLRLRLMPWWTAAPAPGDIGGDARRLAVRTGNGRAAASARRPRADATRVIGSGTPVDASRGTLASARRDRP